MSEQNESNLEKKLREQHESITNDLSLVQEIVDLCSNSSLSEDELLKKAMPIIEKIGNKHPEVEKELKEVLLSGDHTKLKAYFDKDVQRRANL
ncbi:MAG: hypothetical protein KDK71_04830 [Chlamydiia bacterium]|nr:hypothetical protein [Chlamydiia bacterium]